MLDRLRSTLPQPVRDRLRPLVVPWLVRLSNIKRPRVPGWLRENRLPGQHVPHVFDCVPEKQAAFAALWRDYKAAHGRPSDPVRVLQFINLVGIANTLEEGHYIELGVHAGLTLKLIHRLMDPSKTLYGLDTFKGFDQRDVAVERSVYADQRTDYTFAPTSVEGVAAYLGRPANVKLVPGWFPATFQGLEDLRWRFAHIDFDLYEPTKSALETIWPRLVPGGITMVHDYGCLGFPGVKIAVDEFATAVGVFPVQLSDTWGSVVFRKPRDL